jgi:hypothetical protein
MHSRLDHKMNPTTYGTTRRLTFTAAAGLAVLLATAGCGGRATTPTASAPASSAPSTATTPPIGAPVPAPTSTKPPTGAPAPVPPTTPTGPDRCHTADLAARLRDLDSAPGSRYSAVVLTNRSSSSCRVYGYGGVQLLDAARHPLPTHQVRDRTRPPRLVLLRPGASASSLLHWGAISDETESQTAQCQPTPAYLLVTPPDETQPITVAWTSSEVCSHGRILQGAYAAGTTPTG